MKTKPDQSESLKNVWRHLLAAFLLLQGNGEYSREQSKVNGTKQGAGATTEANTIDVETILWPAVMAMITISVLAFCIHSCCQPQCRASCARSRMRGGDPDSLTSPEATRQADGNPRSGCESTMRG